jgi:radical SAM superfamily enzyme YgiQ (UPF0313 family)
MKVLFISPPATSYIEPKVKHEKPLEVALPRIPFEVLAHLDGSIEPIIIDMDWELDKNPGIDFQEIISTQICKYKPDVVLTSIFAQSMTDTIDQITTAVKEEKKDIPIVVGGQALFHLGERVFDLCPNIDAACLEATALKQVIYDIRNKKLCKKIYNGHQYSKMLPSFTPQKLYCGFPLREFIDFYQNKGMKVYAYLENERGCPFHCTFCAAPRIVKERPIEATVAEAEFLLSQGIDTFYLIDFTFGINWRKSKQLLKAFQELRKRYPKFQFRCITRVDFFNQEMAKLLKDAGCYEIGFGIETSSSEVLKKMNKKTTREQNLQAIEIAAKVGLAVRLFLIVGLPGEDIKDLIRFLHEVNGITRNILLQISLFRDIVGQKFEQRLNSGELKRGIMHQLDFRTDGRKYGLDKTEDIVNFILLALAWPSTEISRRGNEELQNKLIKKDGIKIYSGVKNQDGITRRNDIILIDIGEKKLLYVPEGVSVKIRQCLMECSDDYFEFLTLADGRYSLDQLTDKLLLYWSKGQPNKKIKKLKERRIKEIFKSLLEAGFIQIKQRR